MTSQEETKAPRSRRASDRRRERDGAPAALEGEDPTIAKAFGDDTRRALARPKDETRLHAPDLPLSSSAAEDDKDPNLSGAISHLANADLDKTVVLPKDPPIKKRGGRLVLIKGRSVGARLDIPKSPFLVGRSINADLTLNDSTLSRAHFALWFDDADGIWSLEDLRSTSGTLVNGRVADEEIELRPGDIITVGSIELRFFAIEGEPEIVPDADTHVTRITRVARGDDVAGEEKAAAASKFRKRIMRTLSAALSIVFVVAVASTAIFFATRDPAKASARNREADALVEKAVMALNKKELKLARDFAEAALALSAGHRHAQSALRMVQGEEEAFSALNKAKIALDDDDPAGADRALRRIANTSRFAKERDQVRRRIRKAALSIELERIEKLLIAGDALTAGDALDALSKKYPESLAVIAPLRDRLAKLRREQRKPPKALRNAARAFGVGNFGKSRKFARALARSDDEAAVAFLHRLDDFERVLDQGKKALAKKQGVPASRLLEEARALSVALSGGRRSGTTRKVSKPLADALFLVATADLGRGRRCRGASNILRGLRLSPGSAVLKKKAKELEYEAERALLRAQASTSKERKAKLAADALCLVKKRSSTYKELRALMD